MAIPVDEATYGRWLSDAEPDLPCLLDLMVIVNVAKNPAPYSVLLGRSGDGYEITAGSGVPSLVDIDVRLQSLEANTAVDVALARELEDKLLSPDEAKRLIPLLAEQGRVNRRNHDLCERVIKSKRAVRVR